MCLVHISPVQGVSLELAGPPVGPLSHELLLLTLVEVEFKTRQLARCAFNTKEEEGEKLTDLTFSLLKRGAHSHQCDQLHKLCQKDWGSFGLERTFITQHRTKI